MVFGSLEIDVELDGELKTLRSMISMKMLLILILIVFENSIPSPISGKQEVANAKICMGLHRHARNTAI